MRDWNVVITVHQGGFRRACQLLERFGTVKRTDFYNVLVMKVEEVDTFLKAFSDLVSAVPEVLEVMARVMPAAQAFTFNSPEDFEVKARDVVLGWAPRLAGKSFHVRMHRRGFKEGLQSQQEERMLDDVVLTALEQAGDPARIAFDDPDFILDVETVGPRAGLSLWSREDLGRYPFLKLD